MNLDEMTPEQQDYDAAYIAEGLAALEKQSGLELSEESLDEVIDRARANRGEDGAPLVADVFAQFVADAEAEGTIEDEAEDEALEEFEAEPTNEPSAVQFAAMQRGDYGPELQRQALEAVGLNAEEPEAEQRNDWAGEFLAQQEQLEKKLGRELTSPEAKALEDDAAGTDKPLDLLGRYADVVGRDSRNSDDRHDVMVEAFEDSQNQGNGDGTYTDEWDEPDEDFREPDMKNDDDRQAAMVATMKEGEAA